MVTENNCECRQCKDCCWFSPGWFGSVEEIRLSAESRGLSVEDFCKEFLIKEWWAGPEESIAIPAPRRNFHRCNDERKLKNKTYMEEAARNGKGFVWASWPHNLITGFACIFLTEDEKCAIHESKPTECRSVFGCEKQAERVSDFHRKELIDYWKNNQDFLPEE